MLSIGEIKGIKVLPAPLAGISDAPFRLILREFGAAICFTEMISATGIVKAAEKNLRLIGRELDNGPLIVQLFGKDPEMFRLAAPIVEEKIGPVAFDINMGCPARKVVGSGAGASLMKDISLAERIVKALRYATRLPVSVKLRSGWEENSINVIEYSRMAEQNGVDYLIVHPRTKAMAFSGHSDWSLIGRVKKAVKIPVVGNGDVRSKEDYLRMIEETNCDAVMIGRGLLGRPFLIKEILEDGFVINVETIKSTILRHIDYATIPFEHPEREVIKMRKHLMWYTKGLKNASIIRPELLYLTDVGRLKERIEDYFSTLKEIPLQKS